MSITLPGFWQYGRQLRNNDELHGRSALWVDNPKGGPGYIWLLVPCGSAPSYCLETTVSASTECDRHLHRRTLRLLALRGNGAPHRLPHHPPMHAQLPRNTDHRPYPKLILPANLLV